MFTRDSVIISHNIKTPLTSISRAVGNILQLTYGQLIKSLFSNGEQGFFYDPNDLSTMYQDANGTKPVTAAGQPVGLILDKSKGLALGAENMPLPLNFANWSRTAAVTSHTNNSFTVNSNGGVAYPFPSVQGNTYILKIKGTTSSSSLTVRNGSTTSGQYVIPTGAFDVTIISPALFNGASSLYLNTVSGTVTIESISMKQLTGNHAYQSISAARPILRDTPRRIDFDAVDDKLITNLPTQVTGCTVIRSVPNVGTQILTNQTIPTPYNDNTDHCGLIVINRALTATETSQITKLFNKASGV